MLPRLALYYFTFNAIIIVYCAANTFMNSRVGFSPDSVVNRIGMNFGFTRHVVAGTTAY